MSRTKNDAATTFEIPMDRLTPEIIDLAYDEGRRRLEYTTAKIAETLTLVQTILGWYIAADISLIGILAGQVTGTHPSPAAIALTSYGIVFISAAALCFWRGALFNVSTYGPGAAPVNFLSEETVGWLEQFHDKDWVTCKKYQCLLDLQESINRNTKISLRVRRCYRTGVNISLAAAAVACVILFSLAVAAMLA